MGSLCWFLRCAYNWVFFSLDNHQKFLFYSKTMNLTKTLSPFVWATLFQLRDLKLPDLNKL